MTSSIQSDNRENGIHEFEKVLAEVRRRNGGPHQHQVLYPSVIPPQMHASSELVVSSANPSSIGHPLIPSPSENYGSNQLENIPDHLRSASAHPIHLTEAATCVNLFQCHLPFDAKQQTQYSTGNPYGMYPESLINSSVQFTSDTSFKHQMIHHRMQPYKNIRPSTSSLSPSLPFPEINHHLVTRSPECQSTSDSSLQGDSASGPVPDERKARNRVAAMKCRAKKLEQIRRLEKRVADLRNLNMDLQKQVLGLRDEIQSLHCIRLQHRNSGCRI